MKNGDLLASVDVPEKRGKKRAEKAGLKRPTERFGILRGGELKVKKQSA